MKRILILTMLLLVAMSFAAAKLGEDLAALVKKAEPWPAAITIQRNDAVTKDAYLRTASVFIQGVNNSAAYYLKQPKPYANMGFNIDNARWLAFSYAQTNDEGYAKLAAGFVEHAHRLIVEPQTDKVNTAPGWLTIVDLYFIDKWLQNSPAYTAQHKQWARAIALRAAPSFPDKQVEYGSFNRSFHGALTGEALLALVPTAPDAPKWRKFVDTVWGQWWKYRNQDESTDHYTALWFRYLLMWVEIRGGEKEFWADPGVKKLMERYLYHVFPMGAFPHYSDSCGWNVTWGHWVHIFEACATHYKDGRFKWAAHRIYDYGVNRIEKLGSWSYTGEEAGWSLLKAYAIADDTIQEKPREFDVALLVRHKVVQRSEQERMATRQTFDLLPEMAPDKLVFYGGSDRDALSLLVDAVDQSGHSHNRRPTMLALADHQSVLVMSLGYMDRRPEDHNMPLLFDTEGYPYDNTPYHNKNSNNLLKEAIVVDLGAVGYGKLRIENFHGYPAGIEREIVFIKNAGVVIKDTLAIGLDLETRWGPLYRARNLGPDYGANWVNTYLGEWVPLRGLGVNAAVYTRWRNSPRDLLIYFLPEKGANLLVMDESGKDTTLPLPLRVQYVLRELMKKDLPQSSTTLLLPHAPGNGKPFADSVRILLNDPLRTVFQFTDANGATNLVVLNRSGQPISAANLTTDAKVACVQTQGGRVSVALYGGAKLTVGDKDLAKLAPGPKTNVVPAP
ncbi:MAG: hypothetical protein ACYC7E_08155 [Armatimonadota bacterium]